MCTVRNTSDRHKVWLVMQRWVFQENGLPGNALAYPSVHRGRVTFQLQQKAKQKLHSQATYRHKGIVERYHSQFSRCCEEAKAYNPHSGDAAGNSWKQVIATIEEAFFFPDAPVHVRAHLFRWNYYYGTLRVLSLWNSFYWAGTRFPDTAVWVGPVDY